MPEQKKPVEITCPECGVKFRLWIPAPLFLLWKDGTEVGCVKCAALIKLEPDKDSLRAVAVKKKEVVKQPVVKAPPPETTQTVLHGDIVLMVDDDALIRKMAENVLKAGRFAALTAATGTEALDLIEKNRVSIVVVDLHLKNPRNPQSIMDGEEFLQRLADTGKKIPAIVTTGKELIDDIILETKWYELNVRAFIQKGSPFWSDELIAKVKEILKID